jgi:AcrR family transcriptional regulator
MSETKDRLLRAGERLFRAQGYCGTGLKQLAAEAQAPWSSMYHFFPDGKEQLAEEVIRYGGELYAQMIRQCFASIRARPSLPCSPATPNPAIVAISPGVSGGVGPRCREHDRDRPPNSLSAIWSTSSDDSSPRKAGLIVLTTDPRPAPGTARRLLIRADGQHRLRD